MGKRLLGTGLACMIALEMVTASFAGETETEAGAKKDIVILVTSDVHCGVDKNFGYEGLKQFRDTIELNGCATLLVDDGDSIQGEAIGTVTQGDAIIDLMNAMDYDVAIPGNHEFDYGMDTFLRLTQKAEFPYISCNFNKAGDFLFDRYVIKEIEGTKIAFVGVTTPKTLMTSSPVYFQDEDGNFIYNFMQEDTTGERLYEAVQSAVDDARQEGADYVFVMAHLGNEDECRPWTYADVISHISGIDGFLDGHSHDTDQVTMKDKDGNDVFRMAVGTKLNAIGYVKISAEDGSVSHDCLFWMNPISLPEMTHIRNEITPFLEEKQEELGSRLNEVIAKTSFDLVINDPEAVSQSGERIRLVRRAETNLGDLIADAYLASSGADVAIINGGGYRIDLHKGDITYKNILEEQPFGNSLYVIEVTGQQILDALEWGAREVPEECGGFPQVAGMTYEIDTETASSCTEDENGFFTGVDGTYRVKHVMIRGEALDPEKTYSLASNNYVLMEHGDGYTMFDGCNVLQEGVLLDNQLLIQYLQETLGGVVPEKYADPYGEGRIIAYEGGASISETETEG